LRDRIIEILEPTDGDIQQLFAGAKAFVFPSFAEGFGLPPLEAMASGVPVVCSDIPVFREVYGDAVCYVEPARPESIADGIRRVLADPSYAAGLSRKGRDRAEIYRKERSMNAYLDLIRTRAPRVP
jgi:glycosyltransferase involved in cell wall biosynthesis